MSNTENQESVADNNNTTEARLSFADKAEKLLRTILVALGYENVGALRGEDLITSITAWVTLLITMKREPGGSYASFWARAFLDVCKDLPVDDAAECADKMTNHFARRYPPMLDDVAIDDDSRDTQSDLQSAMSELDKQTQLVWQLESELVAIRKLNEHHASELATVRNELAALTSSAIVPLAKPERVEPGQRWAFVMTCVPPFDIPNTYCFVDEYNKKKGTGYIYVADTVDMQAAYYLGTDKV
ncbi:MAG: hypothetical protein E6Q97_21845 [Desulfurellales bacterium]|nr:MAG: hypothetical protein E6Q97_21845 [Desulfurellales bacterium]